MKIKGNLINRQIIIVHLLVRALIIVMILGTTFLLSEGDDCWIFDLGASHQMTSNRHLLMNYQEFSQPEPEAWKKISVALNISKKDLEIDALQTEIFSLQVSSLLTGVLKKAESEKQRATSIDLFTVLNEEPECYGNTVQLIKIALTLPLTSCSAERAFSKLKIIKFQLRSTMSQKRLQSLMFLSIESDIMEGLDTERLHGSRFCGYIYL